jgi:hypothetical protein
MRGYLLSFFLVLSGACGDSSETGLFIEGNRKPTASCGLPVSDGRRAIDHGLFDLVLGDRSSYVLTPIVTNELDTAVTFEKVHIEASEIRETGDARLSFICAGGLVCDHWVEELCTGSDCPTIAPGESASFEIPALSSFITRYYQSGLDLAISEGRVPPQYEVRSTMVLETSDGVMSDPFSFELTICLGCLVEYPAETDDPRIPGQDCCGGGPPASDACYPGQDDMIDCRECIRTVPEICNFGLLSCN